MATRFPRLPSNWKEQPQLFERYWDETLNGIEDIFNQILALPIIIDALANLEVATAAAQAAADAAQTAADGANTAADALKEETSLTGSYPSNFTAPLLSADDLGNVTIANHDRVYGNSTLNPTVSVTGDTIATAEVAGSVLRFYYVDSTRVGGAVTYLYTVDPATPPVQTGDTHSVGVVTIPATGTVDGADLKPPGYVYQ